MVVAVMLLTPHAPYRACLLEALVPLDFQEAHDQELHCHQGCEGCTIVLSTSIPPDWLHTQQLLAHDTSYGSHGPASVGLLGLDVPIANTVRVAIM